MNFLYHEIKAVLSIFEGNEVLLLGDIVILFLIGTAGIFFIRFLKGLEMKKGIERIKQRFVGESEARDLLARRELNDIGYKEKHTLIEKLDIIFKQAGYISYENGETTEVILLRLGIGILSFAVIIGLVTHNASAIAIAITFCIVLFFAVTFAAVDKNYVQIENEIMRFINIADGYAAESDDVTYIIGKTYPSLKAPLYAYGKDFYYEALHIGAESAFQHFEERISHKKFREVIHNIHICSKTSSNYKKIFSESRTVMRDYIDAKRERKNLRREKSIDFCMVLIIIAWCFFMAEGLAEDFHYMIFGTQPGNILVAAFFILTGVGVLMMFQTDKK